MLKKNRFWIYELEQEKSVISLIQNENIDEDLEKAVMDYARAEEDRLNVQKELDDANAGNVNEVRVRYWSIDKDYIEKRARVSRLEEQHNISMRNQGMQICIERLKDIYSRKENIIVTLVIKGISDGKLISTVGKIKEDIYKLEEFGVYLTPPYYDELAKLISNIYYDIDVQEREFIENDVPESAVRAFANLIYDEIKESEDKFVNKKNGGYYDIPVKIFKEWYENSPFRRFTLTSLKEALIIHGYARANKGRNEYTVANVGKVVRLMACELKKVEEHEE